MRGPMSNRWASGNPNKKMDERTAETKRGCPIFLFSTPHVDLFNFDPPERGGRYVTPSPPPNKAYQII